MYCMCFTKGAVTFRRFRQRTQTF